MLIPISTEHVETKHRPIANLAIIAFTCVASIALMRRLPDAVLASFMAHGDPLHIDGWLRHLPLVRSSADPLQLLGHTLLHADRGHLLGNMLLLFALGNPVNARLGHLRYLLLYAVAAAVGGIGWLLLGDGQLMIGASGAVMGVVAAYLALFPLTRVNVIFWATSVVVGLFLFLWLRIMPVEDRVIGLCLSGGVAVACMVASFHSLAERTPPEGVLLRMIGFWSFPVAGFWVVLWFVGWDVVAVVNGVGGRVANEAHLGGSLGGFALSVGFALTGLVRGTRDDPTLPELVGLIAPRTDAVRSAPTFAGLAAASQPPTRRYNRALTFSDYARQRRAST